MSSNTLNLVKRFWIEDKDVRLKGWGLLVLVLFLQVARAKSYTYLSQLARNQMNAIVKFVTKASSNSPSFPPSNEYEDVERSIVKHMAGVIILYPIGKIYSLTLRYLQQMWISHLTKQLLRNYVENLSHVKKISLNKRAQESKPHALSESNNKDKSKQEEGGDNDDDDDDDGDDEEQNPPHDNDEETKEKEKKSKKSGKQKNAIKYEELIHPDQRIADDCEKFVQVFLSLTLEMFEAGIHLYFFASLLRSISPRLGRDALLAATFGTIATLTIGGKLPLLYKHERDANGQYRYFLTRCREYAESIAFIGGQHRELAVLEAKHERVLSTIWSRRALQDTVGYFTTTYSKVASLVPIFVLLSKIIENGHDHHGHSHTEADHHGHSHVEADNHGHSHSAADKDHHGHSHAAPSIGGHGHSHGGIEVDHNEGNSKDISLKNIDVGTFSQVVEAYGEILFHLSIVSERYHDFARLKAYSNELQSLFDQTEKTNILTDEDNRVEIQYLEEDSVNNEWLKFDDLTLYIPLHPSLHKKPNPAASAPSTATNHTTAHDTSIPGSDKVLIRSLSIRAPVTGGLLVSGGSGVGKTTLLRAVAGLWEYGQGKVQRRKQIFFIPQVPYMLIGTLREQLYYPNYPPTETGDDEEDNRLIGLLDRVGLSHISMRLNESRAWGEELSLGEQQRIAFARLVLSGARYAILDEATSACDIENEAKMYEILEEHCVAWVSVGHRPTIERFHEEKLFLEPNGVWHLFARSQGSDGSEVLDHSFSQINSDILISPLKSFDDGSNNGHILRAGESDGLLSNGFSSPEPIILTPTISTVPSEGSDKIENKNQGR